MHWIIGDVHGMIEPLEALLEGLSQADRDPVLIFVGDYVNRGPNVRGVIELLLTLNNAHFVRGNHDDVFGQVLFGHSYCPNATQGHRFLAFQWFMRHGLATTLSSYGVNPAELQELLARPSQQRMDDVLACVPETHRRFMRHLEPVMEHRDFFVAHGLWEPDDSDMQPPMLQRLADSAEHRESLLWGRFSDRQILSNKAWHRTGYFGHTPVECYLNLLPNGQLVAIRGPKIVLMDTGCALGPYGRLTGYCHETQSLIQTSHFGKLIVPR
jgi:serine/threonine protein phosphatase 1